MKKNGFTVIEVVVSFALTMIIVLLLFQVIIMLKQIYTNNFLASDMVLQQSNISQMINNDLITGNYGNIVEVRTSYYTTSSACYMIYFEKGSKEICYTRKTDSNDFSTISYDDYEFKLNDNSVIGLVDVIYSNDILRISIPITNKEIPNKTFGIKALYINK